MYPILGIRSQVFCIIVNNFVMLCSVIWICVKNIDTYGKSVKSRERAITA